jgi:tRNA nucleotidyltransferase (CCA-adding enzyme)
MDESEPLSTPGLPEEPLGSRGVANAPLRSPGVANEQLRSPQELLERLRARPGGAELLELAPAGAYLVGGAVRDLLCDRTPRELDVVLAVEDAPFGRAVAELAGGLAARFGVPAGSNEHGRFGTAIVEWDAGRIDIAAARRERYPTPGALPEVERASLAEDLRRRDFTVNALAIALGGTHAGELLEAEGALVGELLGVQGALADLRAGRLRVLHERSFLDDPTRLLRLARYRSRLGFAVEERTAELAAAAVAGGALGTVSGARVGAELRLALAEPDPPAALAELARLGVLGALHPRLRFEPAPVRRALALVGVGATGGGGERRRPTAADRADVARAGEGRPSEVGTDRAGSGEAEVRAGRTRADVDRADLLMLAAIVLPLALRADGNPRGEIVVLLDRLEFPAGDRDRVAAAAAAIPVLVDELPRVASPSALRAVALPVPPEGVALAGAVSEPAAAAAQRWLEDVRHVRLAIGGQDLLAAGIPEGPEIGRRLETALRLRLDGELPDEREAQLRGALAAE